MNLNNSEDDTETCNAVVGDKDQWMCQRPPHETGPHAIYIFDGRRCIMYREDNPKEFDHDHCATCLETITDANEASGWGSAFHCKACIGPIQEAHREANRCKACGYEGPHKMRNYSMMWHEADIHCGRCGVFHRYWDAG